jgi:pilus assembly protein Flp/PilA
MRGFPKWALASTALVFSPRDIPAETPVASGLGPSLLSEESMTRFVVATKRIVKSEEGATMVEYGLMLALIAIVAMAGAALIGTSANSIFGLAASTL